MLTAKGFTALSWSDVGLPVRAMFVRKARQVGLSLLGVIRWRQGESKVEIDRRLTFSASSDAEVALQNVLDQEAVRHALTASRGYFARTVASKDETGRIIVRQVVVTPIGITRRSKRGELRDGQRFQVAWAEFTAPESGEVPPRLLLTTDSCRQLKWLAGKVAVGRPGLVASIVNRSIIHWLKSAAEQSFGTIAVIGLACTLVGVACIMGMFASIASSARPLTEKVFLSVLVGILVFELMLIVKEFVKKRKQLL